MRLWHKYLIPVLPRQQLLGQWRECCLIAKNVAEQGTPNHILVNPIMDYPIEHFISYTRLIVREALKRGYKFNSGTFGKYMRQYNNGWFGPDVSKEQMFSKWHNRKYLIQCLANLEEKHDRGGISDEEWKLILQFYSKIKK